MQERFACGSFEGTGSALNVICGFKPRYVKLYNYDATNPITVEWWDGMGAADGLKNGNSTWARLTTTGITVYEGTDAQGSGQGFTVGTDAVNGSGETCFWVAIR